MACELIEIPGMGTGIICSRGVRAKKCQFCGAVCTKECDYPTAKKSGTCDAKMCDRCATAGGVDLDYCPNHAAFVFPMAEHRVIVASLRSIKEGIRIDRGFSVLANPFKLANVGDAEERKLCLRNYRLWLWDRMNKPEGPELAELQRLAQLVKTQDVTLLCWCASQYQNCHGQIVAKAMNWLLTG